MAFVPMTVNGRTRLIDLPGGASGEDAEEYSDEQIRITEVARQREFYEGTQYEDANAAKAQECGVESSAELPEHERLHNYSTHVSEAVDFVADQLSAGFTVKAKNTAVQQVLDEAAGATDALSSDDSDVTVTCDDVMREALVADDVPYEVKWNPFDETVYYEFWDSENVQFINPFGTHVSKVIRREQRWVEDEAVGATGKRQVEERVEYTLEPNEVGKKECVKKTFWDQEEEAREIEWLGLPMIPWGLLRCRKAGLRGFRGKSFITSQVMDQVRRYDALEQYGFLITRYNSHGNLVVIGDAAAVQLDNNGGVNRDVADVVSFPEGTNAFPLRLDSNPEMIEHQRKVLEEAIYKKFGLTRVEPDTLESLGQVSGYALEILNRKSEGTLSRVTRQWKKDWVALANLTLDVFAYRQNAKAILIDEDGDPVDVDLEDPDFEMPDDVVPLMAFWDVDPQTVFPERTLDITMGTGYIVDDVAIRDDFTAKLISQQEALRKRGYQPKDISKIMREQKEAAPAESQVSDAARAAAEADDTDDDESDDSGTGRGTLSTTARAGGNDE